MKSLMLKDIIALKSYLKTLFVLIGFFVVVTFSMDEPSFLSGMIILTVTMFPITTFSYDKFAKWDLFSQTLPITRKQAVTSKYMLGLMSIALGVMVAIVLYFVISIVKSLKLEVFFTLQANIAIGLVAVIFLSIMLPLVYKFGVERSRLLMIMVLGIPSLLFFGLSKSNIDLSFLSEITATQFIIVSGLVALCAFIISFFTSVRIYENMEF